VRTVEEIKADIKAATSSNDARALLALAEEMATLGTPVAEAIALTTFGTAYRFTGEYERAIAQYQHAGTLYETLGDRPRVASVTHNIGLLYNRAGNREAALEHYYRAVALYEEIGDRPRMADIALGIGNLHWRSGDYSMALEYHHRALAIYEDLGNSRGVADVSGSIGSVHCDTGDYPTALEYYHRAQALYEERGDRHGVAIVIANVGTVHAHGGDYPAALEHYHRALGLYTELGERTGVANVTSNIGMVNTRIGDHRAALENYDRALALHEELGNRGGVANVTGNIGSVYERTGDNQAALEQYHRALALYEELGERSKVAGVLGNIVSALLALGQDTQAITILDRQSTMRMDDPEVRAEHHTNRATIAERRGDVDGARTCLLQALDVALEAGARDQAARIHQLLRDLAQKRNDFAGYIEHNNEYTRITEEIRGKEATQKLAMMEAQRSIEAELRERDKERALLYGTLPKSVADRMIRGEDVSGDHFDHAAVMFLDIVGFTTNTSTMPPAEVVKMLEYIFSTIDGICETHNVIKIKTIGDSYMCFRGDADAATNAQSIARVGIAVMQGAFTWNDGEKIQFRGGMHIGTATAGVIGTQRLQYDVWGDTVNVASRMESTSEPGRIHVSEAFANVLRGSTNSAPYNLKQRGEVEIKGKGAMNTYWLESA
jgi:adenylate cyclase